jgi:GT2 family glycosyltransferase
MTFRPCAIVPVYNHGESACRTVATLAGLNVPIFVINDGSNVPDSSLLHTLPNRFAGVQVIDHSRNGGKGAAVTTGLRAAHRAGFTHALQIDADGQHNTDDVPRFLALAEENPDAVVVGVPQFDGSVPKSRLVARYLTHVWIWIETWSFAIRDSMCGFRVYPLGLAAAIVDTAPIGRRMDFDPEILVRLHWEGARFIGVPTRVIYHAGGLSNFRLWHDNALISWMHVRLVFGMVWRLLYGRWRRRTVAIMPSGSP